MIRLATPRDAAGIHAIYAPLVRETFISFELEAPTESQLAQRVAATLRRFPWLVEEDAEGIAGYAYACEHRERLAYQWSVDVSCYVHPRARRRGVGRSLYHSLLAVLRAQGFCNAFAGIALPNPASVALHESVGFRLLGHYRNVGFKAGAWRDTGWFQCPIGELPAQPRGPRAIPELEGEVLERALRAASSAP
jgi:L-amino acid N-acyltransferase YncA